MDWGEHYRSWIFTAKAIEFSQGNTTPRKQQLQHGAFDNHRPDQQTRASTFIKFCEGFFQLTFAAIEVIKLALMKNNNIPAVGWLHFRRRRLSVG